jgi:ribonuclease P protein component
MFARGKRSRTAHLDVYDSPSPVARSRVGLVVPRHGRRIVDRNRLKRRLREILRKDILPGLRARGDRFDILVRARREAYAAGYDDLLIELEEWLERKWPLGSS